MSLGVSVRSFPFPSLGVINNGSLSENEVSYKIIADPYYKRISIEKYIQGSFNSLLYDSAIFDFRHLKPAEQNAWQKTTVNDEEAKVICHIRNQDDRLILI